MAQSQLSYTISKNSYLIVWTWWQQILFILSFLVFCSTLFLFLIINNKLAPFELYYNCCTLPLLSWKEGEKLAYCRNSGVLKMTVSDQPLFWVCAIISKLWVVRSSYYSICKNYIHAKISEYSRKQGQKVVHKNVS